MAHRDITRKRIQKKERINVLKRDKYICGYCGKKKKSSSFTAVMIKNFYLIGMSRVFVLIVMHLINTLIFAKVVDVFLKKYLIQGVLFAGKLLLKKRQLISFSSLKLLAIHYPNG